MIASQQVPREVLPIKMKQVYYMYKYIIPTYTESILSIALSEKIP